MNIQATVRDELVQQIVDRRNAELRGPTEPDLDAAVQVSRQAGERQMLNNDQTLGKMTAVLTEVRRVAADLGAEPRTTTGDAIDEAVDSLFQGDEERAKELLRQAIASEREAASQQAAEAVERTVVTREAVRQLEKDYPQLAADPTARRVADEFLWNGLAELGIPARLDAVPIDLIPTAIDRAGARAMDWMRSKGSPRQQPSESIASGARSASDVIASMSAARRA